MGVIGACQLIDMGKLGPATPTGSSNYEGGKEEVRRRSMKSEKVSISR